jgi:hypothetical protein
VDQVPRGPDAEGQPLPGTVPGGQAPHEPGADPRPRRTLPRQPPRRTPRGYQPGRPPPPPPAREPEPEADADADASWISSVFDAAPETPGEVTEPNGARPAIAVSAGRPPKRENRVAIIAVATLAVVGLLAYLLANVFSSAPAAPRAAGTTSPSRHPGTASSSPRPAPSHTASAPVTPPLVPQTLHPASAQAFGPGGVGHGDNPQYAAQAIDASPATSWQSDWYGSAHFGNLQSGTGLLLDMGRTVTISSAVITLGPTPGADLQLRAGSSASLAALRPVASANNAGGVVRLRLSSPAHARYLLIWFTSLPPDTAGTYQVKVYNITVKGTR